MDISNKDLLVLIDGVDLKSIDASLIKNCDRLAMTPAAMLTFEQSGLSYRTFDDFYDYRQFRLDNTRLIKATEDLFSVLDKSYEPFLKFPRAFTGNIYGFLVFFADIYYISRVCEKTSEAYYRIYLVSSPSHQDLFKVNLEFSSDGLMFPKFTVGLDNKVKMFKACLPSKCICLGGRCRRHFSFDINEQRLFCFLRRIPRRALKDLLRLKSFFSRPMDKRKKIIFVIQDGYEVNFLKKYMPEFMYINPINRLLEIARDDSINRLNLSPLFTEELKEFVKKWFPNFEKYIFELFTLYHSKILCHLNSFSENFKKIFGYYKPVALFYSIGALKIHEDLCAHFANQRRIPVFYFQHGGTSIFYKHLYHKYIEQNHNIEKINIYQSKVEKEFFAKNILFESQALGSIGLHHFYCGQKKRLPQARRSRKTLYCQGPLLFSAYKDVVGNISEDGLFKTHKDVIDIIDEFQLKMDIKIHPENEGYNYLYFRELLRSNQSKNIRVLKGFPVEEIIKNYGLLILDYIGSALVPLSIVLDIPIIMYLKDPSYLREETIIDTKKRFYLVTNKSDLGRYISLYAHGDLESKFSLDIVDKYVFPINTGDPGVHISDYIQRKID